MAQRMRGWVLYAWIVCLQLVHAATPMVAGGGEHAWVLKDDGTVVAMGADSFGQLGQGRNAVVSSPTQAIGLTGVASVSVSTHALALKSDGSVWVWGKNDAGQLGDGSQTTSDVPVRMPGMSGVVAVAAGMNHSLLLKSDGTVWGVGKNNSGQLGTGTDNAGNALTPVQAAGLTGIAAIAAGFDHSVAVRNDGTVWTWGLNGFGALGIGVSEAIVATAPVQVAGLTEISQIAASYSNTSAIRADGSVWAWGTNSGLFGDGSTMYLTSPERVTVLADIRSISIGFVASAVRNDGTVWSWGWNGYGTVGAGGLGGSTLPVAVTGLSQVRAVAAGWGSGLALKEDGTVWQSGMNIMANFFGGRDLGTSTASQMTGLSAVTRIASGDSHNLALKSDGTVWSWGWNGYGQLGDGSQTDHATPAQIPDLADVAAIAAGWYQSLALKRDGTVWGWGNNSSGQLGETAQTQCTTGLGGSPPCNTRPAQIVGLNDAIALATGMDHSLALKADGSVWAWGNGNSGQLGNGGNAAATVPVRVSGLAGVTAVAAAYQYSLALKSDGTVWAWGNNYAGQLGDGTSNTTRFTPVQVQGLADAIAIAAGDIAAYALKADGTVWAWGGNDAGQFGDGTYAPRTAPVLATNETADGPLDLIPATANNIPADKLPAFYVAAAKTGGLSATSLSATLKGGTAARSRGDGYNVYVAAMTAGQLAGWWQLDAGRSWSALSWPMAEFMAGVDLGSQSTLLQVDILENANLTQLGGSVIYLGYGISPDEMLAAGRYRDIYAVPVQ